MAAFFVFPFYAACLAGKEGTGEYEENNFIIFKQIETKSNNTKSYLITSKLIKKWNIKLIISKYIKKINKKNMINKTANKFKCKLMTT